MDTKYFYDAYDVLGTARTWAAIPGHSNTPSQEELDELYEWHKAEEYDPSDPKEVERHARLDEAYRILSDSKTRAQEDEWSIAKYKAKCKRIVEESEKKTKKQDRKMFWAGVAGNFTAGVILWAPPLLFAVISVCLALMVFDVFPLIDTSGISVFIHLAFAIVAVAFTWTGKTLSAMAINSAPILGSLVKIVNTILFWIDVAVLVIFALGIFTALV